MAIKIISDGKTYAAAADEILEYIRMKAKSGGAEFEPANRAELHRGIMKIIKG
jgi:hypothetical protein